MIYENTNGCPLSASPAVCLAHSTHKRSPKEEVPENSNDACQCLVDSTVSDSAGRLRSSTYLPQKEIIDPSGYTAYQAVSEHNPSQKGTEEIASKWTDSEGNIWYKTFGTASTGDKVLTFQVLQKLNKFGKVRECVIIWLSAFNPNSYPAKIDRRIRLIEYTIARENSVLEGTKEGYR